MTDTTEPTELLAFKRQKDGYKVTVKISMCISVVLSYQPFANVFREVRLLKWPVTIKNFALALQLMVLLFLLDNTSLLKGL